MTKTVNKLLNEAQMFAFMEAICAFNYFSTINNFRKLFGQYRADDIQAHAKRFGYDSMVKTKLSADEKARFLGYISSLLASGSRYDDYCRLVVADN